MAETAYFVQLPHPGREHTRPRVGPMPWNVGNHRRKFLLAPGRCVDADDGLRKGDVVFWGEWEPPSHIERRWPAESALPQALHRPYWIFPVSDGFRQNTDPWGWGKRMLYSNCKQIRAGKPTGMQKLTRGSVICFGSTIAGEFCADTVFVVADHQPWTPADATDLDVGQAFGVCTADALATTEGGQLLPLTLYRGATFEDPVEGMYSFVPARSADEDDPRFPRPAITPSELINPASKQAPRGVTKARPISEVQDAWAEIRKQVFDAGLLLAVHLETPPLESDEQAVPDGGQGHC